MNIANNLSFYLIVSAVLFVLGVIAALSRRNTIGIFMGVELILNAAALNFVAVRLLNQKAAQSPVQDGSLFALFIIVLAAIEAAVALAIVLRVFAMKRSIDPDKMARLKG
ncbi:MAG: NADH-quinone oxidoreductase subunit NuoK [Bdellovibrionota bacterium]